MSLIYRTPGPWGSGKGSDLAPTEVDNNFWQVVQSVAAKAAQGVGISHFIVTGDQMTVVLTDATMVGPYTLPTAHLIFVGTWQPSHAYLVNQIFTEGGATYVVTFNHTSAATFDPGANDGAGNDFYGLLLSSPNAILPAGGAVGSVLTKATTTDYSVFWNLSTLAGLSDVLSSPGPVTGQLVYWNGAAFGYLPQASVIGAPQSLAGLSDVLASPAPTDGEAVVWSATAGAFTYGAGGGGGAPPAFTGLSDVLASPAPTFGQIVYWNGSFFTYETVTTGLLTDWNPSSIQDRDVMYWDAAAVQWRPRQAPPIYDSGWGGSFTLALSHAQCLLDINSGGSAITIPPHSDILFSTGTTIWFRQGGSLASPFSVVAGAGVTLNKPAGRKALPRAIGSIVMLQQTGTLNTWVLSGDLAVDSAANSLAGSGSITIDPRLTDSDVINWTPTGNATLGITASAPALTFAKRLVFVITTTGTTTFTITFSALFKSTGTLSTGTVASKVFVIQFICDGTNYNEVSRTTAM